MVTSAVNLTNVWQQITTGTQDYVVSLEDLYGETSAAMTLSDTTPVDTSPFFTLKEGEGFSHITHSGKLWARIKSGAVVSLIVTK